MVGKVLVDCADMRTSYSGVNNAELSFDVQIVSPLDDFLSKHRVCNAIIPFSDLHASCRKDFYGRAA